jgi:NitT/TauT family transport system ATP-binding protein
MAASLSIASVTGPGSVTGAGANSAAAATMVDLFDVTLRYPGQDVAAVEHLSLRVAEGEFVAVVGPSGCGKSSLMKLVTGLVRPTHGGILVSNRELAGPLKIVGMAFQNPTMLPWLTIRQNVMLPLKIVEPFKSQYHSKKNSEFRERANVLLDQVGLGGYGDKRPWQLSGGMLQRASLCRALIHEPKLLLLDEPFGALDQFTREDLWNILQSLWMSSRPTVILVTHDLREAMFLASRILVMKARPGKIIKIQDAAFPYPRTVTDTYSKEFAGQMLDLRNAIFEARQDELSRGLP